MRSNGYWLLDIFIRQVISSGHLGTNMLSRRSGTRSYTISSLSYTKWATCYYGKVQDYFVCDRILIKHRRLGPPALIQLVCVCRR